ncbi:hypothetical protein SEUCBS140593_007897 [Sporothrix eucalyptigena]|uniref:Dimethylaniline monooxygenase 2 n=1 Tax=Sporothrix eucalyptigena TaxID=1812306 RepID=A0ABP0CH01_9PEZI
MERSNKNIKVAVIGAGALGLVTLKNFLEEGFDATGFERKSYVGGLWKYTLDETTSVLPSTIANISKQRGCYTDFPFPDDTPSLCASSYVDDYLQSYTDHFQLHPRIRLNTAIRSIKRDDENNKWLIAVAPAGSPDDTPTETLIFDKLVMATGTNDKPSMPKIDGLDTFTGRVLHSQAFKRPEDFTGKSVLVVGIGSTAGDTAVALVGHARKIYMAHRSGAYILPRLHNGRSIDHGLTYNRMTIQKLLQRVAPNMAVNMFSTFAKKIQDAAFPAIVQHPEWRLWPAPSLRQTFPTVTDELVPALESGDIVSVPGLRRVVGPSSVELDPTIVGDKAASTSSPTTLDDIDVIIFCTGYVNDLGMSLLEPRIHPARNTNPEWLALPGSRGKPLARLYRNIFSLDYPDSLAFMGAAAFPTPAFQLYDIASMAVAQIWGTELHNTSTLPSVAEMNKHVDAQHAWILEYARAGPVYPQLTRQFEWLSWADEAAGTNVESNLGWGLQGWKFYLGNRRLYKLLTAGVYSPHLYRIFDSDKRKKWPGAREAIERMNQQLEEELKGKSKQT